MKNWLLTYLVKFNLEGLASEFHVEVKYSLKKKKKKLDC